MTLDKSTAASLRRSAAKVERSIALRDEDIVAAVEGGASLREVAEQVGLSHMGVKAIVERAKV